MLKPLSQPSLSLSLSLSHTLFESAMNLLRKSIASSISLNSKPSLVSLCLSSILRESKLYSVQAAEFEKRNSAINDVSEYNTVSGFQIAQRRFMSTSKGRSMRSKVEIRMQRETGKTLREMRRAKKLRKKLMTEDERLMYNLRRAKKKVALLLQKLKKFELPDLPPPRHDPELLTEEQTQAYKKIGFRNRNYVPVGVRGVFGGVVQNMHLHWKFHETVQVCCDNFPKERIREMATMLTRLSGGIVVNIHDINTIIMFRGRNYRQPKNLIPLNTLTKRKALFKARFEQALESQQLNIKKIEQQLRRKGINPEDPVHMASIQRVASTFFRAIDEQEGTPYVFRKNGITGQNGDLEFDPKPDKVEEEDDSDQEELDRYIKEIEDAAGQEWEEEEAAEREEGNRIRYWNKEDYGNRGGRGRFEAGRENSESSEGEVWDQEEEDSRRDDFSGHTKGYRSRELNESRRTTLHDRSRNGSYTDDYREDGFNKSWDKGFSRAKGYRDIGHRGSKDNKGFGTAEEYRDVGHRRSRGTSEIAESGSDDELSESDEDFGNDKRFSHSVGRRDMRHSRSRGGIISESELSESDKGGELGLAASRDYAYDFQSRNDGDEKKRESGTKNSDENWDSD